MLSGLAVGLFRKNRKQSVAEASDFVTVTSWVAVSTLPSVVTVVAVMVTLPALTPTTLPAASMVATEESLDVHVTSVSESVVSVMFLNCSTVLSPEMESDVAAGFFTTWMVKVSVFQSQPGRYSRSTFASPTLRPFAVCDPLPDPDSSMLSEPLVTFQLSPHRAFPLPSSSTLSPT